VSPASSSSSLVESSEASTIGENEFNTPDAAIRARLEEEFIEQFAVFEPQNTPAQRLIEGIRLQIEANCHFWPVLENCYGNLGIIPGTDATVRDFYYVHYLQHEYLQIIVNHPNPVNPSLHSERDLLDEGLAQRQYLDPAAAEAHLERFSQHTYDDSESDFGAPEEQDFTLHSPHPSAGLTPVLVPETLSANSGENTSQSSALWTTAPSQEGQSQS
jgi:hypothetical protein